MNEAPDQIRIEEIEFLARIGVPEEERAKPQRLTASLTLEPLRMFRSLQDDISGAVDYAQVWRRVREIGSAGERQLIETLAHELATTILHEFRLRAVEVELRKFILPGTRFVAARVRRERMLRDEN